MKSFILTFCLLASIIVTAQFNTSISTLTGYESNINKSPDSYISKDVLKGKDYLHQNSFYQEAFLNLNYKNNWDNNEFRIYINPEIKYYFSETDLNRIFVNTRLKYTYSLSKNIKWESNFRYQLRDQEGQDLDEAELNTPRGYNLSSLNTGLRVRLYKNNRTYIKANYDIKNFDKSDIKKMMYHRYGVYGKFEHRSNLQRYGVTASFLNRNYELNYYTKNKIKTRSWQYLNIGAYFRLPLSHFLSIEPAVAYEKRTDISNNKYGYTQIRSSVRFLYKDERLSVNARASYTPRKFEVLQASTTETKNIDNLTYAYTRVRLDGSYQLLENLDFITEAYLLNRKTNNTNLKTKAYRSYNNYYAGAGFRCNF